MGENNQQNNEVEPKQKSSSGDNSQQSSKQNQTKKETFSQNQTKKADTTQKTKDYSDWVPISTDNFNALLDSIIKGYVVYYNGQYMGSPEYVKMITNEEVAYMHDVSEGGGRGVDRNILAPDTKLIYETEEEVPQDTTTP